RRDRRDPNLVLITALWHVWSINGGLRNRGRRRDILLKSREHDVSRISPFPFGGRPQGEGDIEPCGRDTGCQASRSGVWDRRTPPSGSACGEPSGRTAPKTSRSGRWRTT